MLVVALVVALPLGRLGELLQLPQRLMNLSPYTHVPQVPVSAMTWTPMVASTLAAGFMAVGVVGFRRRDAG